MKGLLPEVIHDEWIDLQARKDKYAEKAGGRIHVRFFRTNQPVRCFFVFISVGLEKLKTCPRKSFVLVQQIQK